MTQKAILLDRDGTLIQDYPYNCDPNRIVLLPGVIAGLKFLLRNEFLLFVVTNQSGINRGLFSLKAMEQFHHTLDGLFRGHGIKISQWYHCPHLPSENCRCRKPEPGLAIQARREFNIDAEQSFVFGDKTSDVGLAQSFGAKGVLISNDEQKMIHRPSAFVVPDFWNACLIALSDVDRT